MYIFVYLKHFCLFEICQPLVLIVGLIYNFASPCFGLNDSVIQLEDHWDPICWPFGGITIVVGRVIKIQDDLH